MMRAALRDALMRYITSEDFSIVLNLMFSILILLGFIAAVVTFGFSIEECP